MIDFAFWAKLRPHQVEPVQHLCRTLRQFDSAVDWSDTGTGKTYVAVATAIRLGLPTLAVVPKISMTAWNRAAEHFSDTISTINYESLRTGHTPFGQWQHQERADGGRETVYLCTICQQKTKSEFQFQCPHHPSGIHCVETRKKSVNFGDFRFAPEIGLLIFDEAHRCAGLDSLNADLLVAAKRQRIKTLMLSATPGQSPLSFRASGYSLDLHCLDMRGLVESNKRGSNLRVFEGWAAQHKCRRMPAFHGLHWLANKAEQRQIMANISAQVIPERGVRVTTDSIPGFPERDISAELYDIDKTAAISDAWEAIEQLAARRTQDKDAEHPLTKILRAHQEIELLKVPLAVELATDALEKGFSIGIFCNFSQTLQELQKRLDLPIIDGSVVGAERQSIIDRYQINEIRGVLVNSKAGGICISLQDLHGDFPRMGFVFPAFSAEVMAQVFGRFHREGGKSKAHYRVLLAAGTIEEKIFKSFNAKRNNIDALTDADLSPLDIPLTKMF